MAHDRGADAGPGVARGADYAAHLRARLWEGERRRTLLAMALLLAGAAVTVTRDLITGRGYLDRLAVGMAILAAMVGAEFAWYLVLLWGQRRHGRPPIFLVTVGAALEANFPTVGILLLTLHPSVGPYRALAAPIVALYFLFIILASLRMRPGVCLAAGVAAFAGYLGATLVTYVLFPEEVASSPFHVSFFVSTAIMMLMAGGLAALVSRQILQSASHAIAASLERQKLEHDLSVARAIQQGLLPTAPPHAEGFDVAGRSTPADQTGGDSFDWLSLSDARTAVTLADVTGHGMGPALLAANLHAYVHAIFSGGSSLRDWVGRLNGYMAQDLTDGNFVTFAAAVLHSPGGAVDMLSAGHGPILLYRSARHEIEELQAQGPPLGVVAGMDFGDATRLDMGAGDALVFATDGLFEQTNAAGEPFGIGRLKESVLRYAPGEAKDVVAGLHDDVRAFAAGAPQADDLTVTVIRRTK
jgi:serine phosphatase RsbU (regulator of sigma subunit)